MLRALPSSTVATNAFGNALGQALAPGAGQGATNDSEQIQTIQESQRQAMAAGHGPLTSEAANQSLFDQMTEGKFAPEFIKASNVTFTANALNRSENKAFETQIAGVGDPFEKAQMILTRARDTGLISPLKYQQIIAGNNQSAAGYSEQLWGALEENVYRSITTGGDHPMSINSRVTGEYATRFEARPSAYWMGLGTLASHQVGQGMSLTSLNPFDGATTLNQGLAYGNKTIAMDMLPMFDVYNKLGGASAPATSALALFNSAVWSPVLLVPASAKPNALPNASVTLQLR